MRARWEPVAPAAPPTARSAPADVPAGFVEVEPDVFEGPSANGGRIRVTLGTPDPDDEDHNCDAMGCRRSHVLRWERL